MASAPRANACRLLLVSLFTPPSTVSATRRPASLARELERRGFRVTVLTSTVSGTGPIAGAERVVRTRDLLTSRINWRRANLRSLKGDSNAAYDAVPSRLARWMITDVQLATWLPFAIPRALVLHREQPFDCVITTGPPHSTHFAGLALRARGVPWIADLQDGWCFEPQPGLRSRVAQAADRHLERFLLGRATAVVGVTDAMANDARARFASRTFTVPVGFDPRESEDAKGFAAAQRAEFLSSTRHSLVYTGSMAYGGLSPVELLAGLRALVHDSPDVRKRLEIVFAGPISMQEREMLEAPDVAPMVRLIGTLQRERALALQRAADSLLVIIDERRPGVTTNKLFEYLAAGRPILVLGADSEAAQIVNELGAGLVVRSSDPGAVADGLRALLDDRVPAGSPNGTLDRYSHASVAERFAEVIEDSIATTSSPAN